MLNCDDLPVSHNSKVLISLKIRARGIQVSNSLSICIDQLVVWKNAHASQLGIHVVPESDGPILSDRCMIYEICS